MAEIVAFGFGSARLSAPSARVMSWVAPSASASTNETDATRSAPSVRVPVLSTHTTSTRASTSTAASSCTRARRRPSRTTPTAKAMLVSSTRPSGIMAATPAIELRSATSSELVERTWDTSRSAAVGTSAQVPIRRIRSVPSRSSERTVREAAGFRGQPGRVGIVADRGHEHSSVTADHEAPREDRVTRLPADRIGFAREQRFVHLEPGRRHDRAVHGELIAPGHLEQIPDHQRGRVHLDVDAVASHPGHRCGEDVEPVERRLGSELLARSRSACWRPARGRRGRPGTHGWRARRRGGCRGWR